MSKQMKKGDVIITIQGEDLGVERWLIKMGYVPVDSEEVEEGTENARGSAEPEATTPAKKPKPTAKKKK